MLNIGIDGNQLVIGGERIERCKVYVVLTRETRLVVYPEGQRPPMVEQLVYTEQNYGWGRLAPEYSLLPQHTIAEYVLWLPKYGRLATIEDALLALNSRLGIYTGDTVGLRVHSSPMVTVLRASHDDIPTPFEGNALSRDPALRLRYSEMMRAYQRCEACDFDGLEASMRAFVESKGKRLPPGGQIRVPA